MSYTLLIQKEAWVELQNAFEWYEEQKQGLGYEFIEKVQACYENLVDNPHRFPHINPNYRRIKTDRFPYILFYEIEDETIIIGRIRHIKQKPL
jgi:toxin ParE1/3/4